MTASLPQEPASLATRAPAQATASSPWTTAQALALFERPFNDLLFGAHQIHRAHFDVNAVQISTLLSIKTGACPEDCSYCAQSSKYDTGLERERLLPLNEVREAALRARDTGATRFCMGAAWRNPTDKQLNNVIDMVQVVKELGMEACVTLGMLTAPQAGRLKEAGLDYYNHNIDTSPEFYGEVISTRSFQDRLDTLAHVRDSGINVCSGGILGMGESRTDRASFLVSLANLPRPPESVPLNMLVRISGTPMADIPSLDPIEFIRTVAVARILMPTSHLRLSAGREGMSEEAQAWCFFAGANSIFYGDKLLTTDNADQNHDRDLFDKLGIHPLIPAGYTERAYEDEDHTSPMGGCGGGHCGHAH
ncbi:MAG: biotin synthase BioB [Halothiobacillus sp. 20-53-49]|nr:biotin synthase BioB [Halothiobacillaceae bacterium]OYV45372.1 MAG: biotin synthase BioB [Halothiobacillus sp. 20-53-49]HUN00944.1 biotin synthase BioB [Halothiobacillus sp.]